MKMLKLHIIIHLLNMSIRSITPIVRKRFQSAQFSELSRKNCESPNSPNSPSSIKSVSRPKSKNETSKPTSPERIFLKKLAYRHNKNTHSEISAELAVNVIKEYLLPMFKQDKKNIQDKKRLETFGVSSKPSEQKIFSPSGSVYSELKLSEHLGLENKEIRKKWNQAEKDLKIVEQEKFLLESELKNLRTEFFNLQSEFNFLNFLYRESTLLSNKQQQRYSSYSAQCEKYEELVHECRAVIDKLNDSIHEEKLINDIRL